jgi:mono/diheme cytochrome c family protein
MTYKGSGIHINGAPGMVDFNGFLLHLVLTLDFTVKDAEKFDRFSRRVLGNDYSSEAVRRLKDDVQTYVATQLGNQFYLRLNDLRLDQNSTKPGFGRIDALGSGGNRLYGILDPKNNRALNSPVKILPLWYAPQYNWVQTNGSIRQPVARNIIESLAVNSSVVFGSEFPTSDWYTSSARLHNMYDLEETISKFKAPVWPEDILGKIDQEAAKRGEVHYKKVCASCHEPQMENRPEPGDDVAVRNHKTYFVLRLFPVDKVGTDPMDAQNFARRTLDASSIQNDLPPQYRPMANNLPGAVIIGMVLQGIIDKQYGTMSDQERDPLIGFRKNLLRACEAYPARPLAGIWAAPPYLHNGSVRTLYQLLLPPAQRERSFCTGYIEYDPVNVGYINDAACQFPWFRFNTQLTGNSNSGHNYGTSLTDSDRKDLIEYLKIIKFPDQGYPLIDPQASCP